MADQNIPEVDHDHHWVPVFAGKVKGVKLYEMRCQQCNIRMTDTTPSVRP